MGAQHDRVLVERPTDRNPLNEYDEPPSYQDAISTDSPDQSTRDPVLDSALHFTQPATIPTHFARLNHPIAIPQVASGLGMPFARAYAPILLDRGIPMASFIELIDNYNVVSASSPPLQVIDAAAGVVGMIPHHYFQLASSSIQLVSKVGNVAISKTRGSMFLKETNREFFAPRGLKLEIVTGEALRCKLGLNPNAPLSVEMGTGGNLSMHERRTAALAGAIAPVTFDVPEPSQQSNLLNRLSAGAQKRNIAKQEKKDLKKQQKHAEKMEEQEGGLSERGREKLAREERKRDEQIAKIQAEAEEKLQRKKSKDHQKIIDEEDREIKKVLREAEKEMRKVERKERRSRSRSKSKDRKDKKTEKLLWIFIDDL